MRITRTRARGKEAKRSSPQAPRAAPRPRGGGGSRWADYDDEPADEPPPSRGGFRRAGGGGAAGRRQFQVPRARSNSPAPGAQQQQKQKKQKTDEEKEDELPERLKGCDPALVKRIEQEIMQTGAMTTFDDARPAAREAGRGGDAAAAARIVL